MGGLGGASMLWYGSLAPGPPAPPKSRSHILDQRRICRWRMMNVMLCMARRSLGTVANLSVVEGSERPMLYQGTCGEGVSGVRLTSAGGKMTERRGRGRYWT